VELKFGKEELKWHRAGCKKMEQEEDNDLEDKEEHAKKQREAIDEMRWQVQVSVAIFCAD